MNRLSIITSFLGAAKNRYVNYQEDRPLEEKMRMAARIEHVDGLELCYPADFQDTARTKTLLREHGLGVSAINFRSRRTGRWMRGSFTSHDPAERREVTDDLKRALELAADLGCNLVTTCPLNEGSDYLFELDYAEAFDGFEGCIREAALAFSEVRIAIEYKESDPRARCLLGNAGETLAFCSRVGLPNVGATLDIGHSLYAGERPAQSLVMLAREGRLFHVHLNDNDKLWDWDMVPGAYNFWDFIEFFYYLRRIGYEGWFAYDIFPKEIDIERTFTSVVRATRKLLEVAARLEEAKVREVLARRDPAASMEYLFSIL